VWSSKADRSFSELSALLTVQPLRSSSLFVDHCISFGFVAGHRAASVEPMRAFRTE
jgi:hypothetical protein